MAETTFRNHYDLARLPYFEVRDGRLVLADPSLGPAIDMHGHLALAFVLPLKVDLHRETPATEHYLPMDRPLNLDVYMNRNFLPVDLRRLKRDLAAKAVTASGMRATHTLPNLAREMKDLGIRHTTLLPIDWPVLSANAETWLDATSGRREFICYGSVHPYALRVERRLDRQVQLGARGIKFHTAVQLCPPDDRRALRLFRLCGERNLPVLFHCGPVGIEPWLGRRFSQVRRYEKAVAENPGTLFLLGHSGALQMEEALKICMRYPNVYLELSCQSVSNIRRILEQAPSDRLVCGSDWPFYHQATNLAKILIATEGDEPLRHKVLYDNAARLLGLEPA